MTRFQRIEQVAEGLVLLLFSIILVVDPFGGYPMIMTLLALSLLLGAARMLIYFFTMARYMVGGRRILYQGIILLDISFFTGSLSDVPLIYVIVYLITIHSIAGGIDIATALMSKHNGSSSWRLKFSEGAVQVLMAAVCLVFLHSVRVVVYVYAAGLAYSALVRFMSAAKNTEVLYIQ